MYCGNCGAQIDDQATRCSRCGELIQKAEEQQTKTEPADQQTEQTNTYAPPVVQPQPAQNSSYAPPAPQQTQQQNPNNYYYNPQAYNPQPNAYYGSNMPQQDETVSMGQWFGLFALNLIPCVGGLIFIIMLFVYAFGSTPKKSLKNFARVMLIIEAVAIVLMIVYFAVIWQYVADGGFDFSFDMNIVRSFFR